MANPSEITTSVGLSRSEERAILWVTCLAAFLFFNSFGSIGVALPAIQAQFGNSLSELQWVNLMGVVTISSLSFCFGRAGGIFGQRRLYKIGVVFYAAGAGVAAISISFRHLLLARAIMAVGLAMALPTSTAILAANYDAHRRGRVLGLFASAIAVGRMTGPTVGGILLQFGSWQWIFAMNFILGFIVSAAVFKIFPGSGERCYERFDIWGALALLVGYPALLVGLTFGAQFGWTSTGILALFVLAVIALASFVRVELETERPLIDIAIFKQRALSTSLATLALAHIIHFPIALCAPLYIQNVLGASALAAGILLAVLPLSTAVFSPFSGWLADRFEASIVASLGIMIIVAGIACYSRLGIDSPWVIVILAMVLIGTGIGIFTPANQKLAYASVTQQDYGVVAAMLSSLGTAAGTIGTTIVVALMEVRGGSRLWIEPATFTGAQQYAFMWLVLVGAIGIGAGLRNQMRTKRNSK